MATGPLFGNGLYSSHASTATGSMMTRETSDHLAFLDVSMDAPSHAAKLFAASSPAMTMDASFPSYHSSSHPDLQQLALLHISNQQAQHAGLLSSSLVNHAALQPQLHSASSAADSLSHAMSLSSEASSQFLLSGTSLSFDASTSMSHLSPTGLPPVHSAPLQLSSLLSPHSPEASYHHTLLHQSMLPPLFADPQSAAAANSASAAAAAVAAAAAALSATQPPLPAPHTLLPTQPFLPSHMINSAPATTHPHPSPAPYTQPPPPPPTRTTRIISPEPRKAPPPTHHQRTTSDPASDCENRDPSSQSRHKDNPLPGTDISLLDYFFNPQYNNSRSNLVR